MTTTLYIEKIKIAIESANQYKSKLTDDVLNMEGMSSKKFRHLLNNLVDDQTRLLEIGTWKGSTLISAIYKNNPEFYIAIDDSSHHGDVTLDFYKNFKQFIGDKPNFLHQDSFTVSLKDNNISGINLYFYDGGHSWEQHYNH